MELTLEAVPAELLMRESTPPLTTAARSGAHKSITAVCAGPTWRVPVEAESYDRSSPSAPDVGGSLTPTAPQFRRLLPKPTVASMARKTIGGSPSSLIPGPKTSETRKPLLQGSKYLIQEPPRPTIRSLLEEGRRPSPPPIVDDNLELDIQVVAPSLPVPAESLEASVTTKPMPRNKWTCADPLLSLLRTRPQSPPIQQPIPFPAHLGMDIPFGGYPCLECGDSFNLKTLLQFHLERRVMKISVSCNVCQAQLYFYNRCCYLAHLRKHSGSEKGNNARTTVFKNVQVITNDTDELFQKFEGWLESEPAKRLSNLEALYDYEFGKDVDRKEAESPHPAPELAVMSTTPSNRGPAAIACTECGAVQANLELLRKHFIYALPASQKQFICHSCQAVYFSMCGFAAHKRTHQSREDRKAPFTCAECGRQQGNSKELSDHLTEHRLAPTILNAWRCQKCSTFYSNWNTLVVHTVTAHSDFYYKCPLCPTAFQGWKNFEDHRNQQHRNRAPEEVQADAAPKCPQCDCIFQNKEQLVDHMKNHLNTLTPFKVFRCPLCGRLMENKAGLVAHLSKAHAIVMASDDIREIPFEIEDQQNAAAVAPETKKRQASSALCQFCSISFGNQGALQVHIKTKHLNKLPDSPVKKSRMLEHTYGKGFMCMKVGCKRIFGNQEDLRGHVVENHADGKHFLCLQCGLGFLSAPSFDRHLRLTHSIMDSTGYMRNNPETLPTGLNQPRCSVCGQSFTSHAELHGHSRQHGLLFLQSSTQKPKTASS